MSPTVDRRWSAHAHEAAPVGLTLVRLRHNIMSLPLLRSAFVATDGATTVAIQTLTQVCFGPGTKAFTILLPSSDLTYLKLSIQVGMVRDRWGWFEMVMCLDRLG